MQSGVFIMQTKSRNPVLTINFKNAMILLNSTYVYKYIVPAISCFFSNPAINYKNIMSYNKYMLELFIICTII